jgi:hypothetical protein
MPLPRLARLSRCGCDIGYDSRKHNQFERKRDLIYNKTQVSEGVIIRNNTLTGCTYGIYLRCATASEPWWTETILPVGIMGSIL